MIKESNFHPNMSIKIKYLLGKMRVFSTIIYARINKIIIHYLKTFDNIINNRDRLKSKDIKLKK